jgi:RND family efflux transporter MFP subunit
MKEEPMNRTQTLSLAALALAGAGAAYALLGKEPVRPPQPQAPLRLRAEGRVVSYPGEDILVSTDLGGTVVQMAVEEGQKVRRGQLLARVDPRRDEAALREAQARLRELEADLVYQESELQRQTALHSQGIASRQALEQSRTQAALAKARKEAAAATAERLGVTVANLRIVAPFDGTVLTRITQPGETVAAGSTLLRLARTDRFRIEAEVDEFDLSRVVVGMPVAVRAEGMENQWRGHVEELPDYVVGRRLKPQDPARPSDTRVLMAKVALDETTRLKLGQRVELELGKGTIQQVMK